MSKELVKEEISPEIINSLILTGDMSKLTADQQTKYYTAVCKSVGVNPLTQPFAIIVLQGKKTLYATKGCTQQLSDSRKINTEIKKTESLNGVYVSSCRATMPDGRYTDDIGAVSTVDLKGADLANAMMKSITKAKRRAVLALCGLGMPDESEIEDMPVQQHKASETGKSRVEALVEDQVEEAQVIPAKEPEPVKKTKKAPVVEEAEITPVKTDDGILRVQGIIEEQPKQGKIEGKGTKYSFRIGDKYYGTFDEALIKKIMECVDKRILVEFTYTTRENADGTKIFQDITGFRQVTSDEVKLPI